ncbi:MAG TPA: RNA polymerase sigma factor [Solirubrobacteraceae bacterium]|jgi:RNA polymerase sigma-70 factor (ECF subfamily)|nr:RNA polymerase sigma factor [Solirubrobacteraceae bacterium]
MNLGLVLAVAVPLLPLGRRAVVDDDSELLARLRAGEEQAFVQLVARHHTSMLRLAQSFVASSAIAEEVVQDTWVGVLRGLDGFAGRSSFKTWLLRILVNRARSTGVREHRSVAVGDAGPAVDQSRFDAAGAWMAPPQHWVEDSDDRLLAEGLAERIHSSLSELPPRQREVVMLRDVDGLSSEEVCAVLAISEANQRVLLHRGRSRLRQALEDELGGRDAAT